MTPTEALARHKAKVMGWTDWEQMPAPKRADYMSDAEHEISELAVAGLAVMPVLSGDRQLLDAIESSEVALLDRLTAERRRGEWVKRDMEQFILGWHEATARIAAAAGAAVSADPTPPLAFVCRTCDEWAAGAPGQKVCDSCAAGAVTDPEGTDEGDPMSDTPTPTDRCPTCDSDDRLWRNKTGGKVLGLDALCPDPWHSSPVDSPEADTPNPADVQARAVLADEIVHCWHLPAPEAAALLDDLLIARGYALMPVEAAAGLRVVQVPDGLPERLNPLGTSAFLLTAADFYEQLSHPLDERGNTAEALAFREEAERLRVLAELVPAAAALLGGETER